MEVISIGLMSGTSMDGIDAAILKTDGNLKIKQLAKSSLEYSAEFKLALREAEAKVRAAKRDVTPKSIVEESTILHARIVNDLLKQTNIKSSDIDVIGYHGQTLYHNPAEKITIQIGDGQLLANLTNIATINDFRTKDILNGGQGAPLAPIYHRALALKDNFYPVAIVNCGGIANITIVEDEKNVIGYDTGPGNVLLDEIVRTKTQNKEFMDFNGKYSSKGQVNISVLSRMSNLLADYLAKKNAKSLDAGDIKNIPEIYKLSLEDACATLAKFTAKTIVESVYSNIPEKWILAGGGWNNPTILKYLEEILYMLNEKIEIKFASEIGWDSVYMEAEIFAYLAVRSLKLMPISIAKITGARTDSLGGCLFYPKA